MKKIFILIAFLICFSSLKADNYYFYNNSRTELKLHKDRIAVIFNDDPVPTDQRSELLKSISPANCKVVMVERNIFEIRSSDGRDLPVSYLTNSSSLRGKIKFITPVYFYTTKQVSIIPADEFVVKLKNIRDLNKLEKLNILNSVTLIGKVGKENGYLLKTMNNIGKSSLDISNQYYNESIFEFCEPNFYYPDYCILDYTPNDANYSQQWALNNTGQTINTAGSVMGDVSTEIGLSRADMNVNLAWDYTTGNSTVKIGILDTGIDSTHPDLRSSIGGTGFDATYNFNGVPRDSNGHGTNCAGLIGAGINNSIGVAGIAGNSKIFSYKIFKANGTTNNVAIGRAFDTAVARGIMVFNNSWGGLTPNSTVTNAINNAYTNAHGGLGGVILFASGNGGNDSLDYPATLSNVITIGASTPHDQKKAPGTGNQFYWGSNYGGNLCALAPTNCYTTDIQGAGGNSSGDYDENFGGTSASCANGTGVAALILSISTVFTSSQVKDFLIRGCEKVENIAYDKKTSYGRWNDYTGYGRLNAYNSVRLAGGSDKTPPTINHQNVRSVNSTYPVSLSAEILDQDTSTVDITTNKPKAFFRINKNNAGWTSFDSVVFDSRSGNNFIFKIPGQGWETQVQYYLKAYDAAGNGTVFPKHAPDSVCICYYKVGSFSTYTNVIPSFAINDVDYNQSSLVSVPSFQVLDTKVDLYARHTYDGDFEVTLFSPDGNSCRNRKCIDAFSGGDGVDMTGASFNDTNSIFLEDGTPPFTGGFFKPDYPFRGLNGIDAGGNWSGINYDRGPGDVGTVDSIRFTLLRTTGTLSPNARLDYVKDSVIDYGSAAVITVKDFYLKNTGTSNLTVSSYNVTGTFASKFSVVNTPPSTIVPNDSGLFQVRYDPAALLKYKGNDLTPDSYENAKLVIGTNDPSKPSFNVSLLNDGLLPVEISSFISEVTGRNVKLTWTTLSEQNNSGFDIESKLVNSSDWIRDGFVAGAGNSGNVVSYNFTAGNLNAGRYNFRLKQIDLNGNYRYFDLQNEVVVGLPVVFSLEQNYPNPFNPVTKINYALPFESNVVIKIFNIQGREVYSFSEKNAAGYYTFNFNASALSSGVYFYRLEAENINNKFVSIKKMVVLK